MPLTTAALEFAAETGSDFSTDVCRMVEGGLSRAELLAECEAGADDDRLEGVRDYVSAVAAAAEAPRRVWMPGTE